MNLESFLKKLRLKPFWLFLIRSFNPAPKFFSFFESYIDFSFENFFKLIFMKFMSIFERFFFFWVTLMFHFKKCFLMNFHEVYEYFRKIFLFLSYILIFHHIFHHCMAQRTSTEVLRILRPRTERVNYLDYLDCSKVTNF